MDGVQDVGSFSLLLVFEYLVNADESLFSGLVITLPKNDFSVLTSYHLFSRSADRCIEKIVIVSSFLQTKLSSKCENNFNAD